MQVSKHNLDDRVQRWIALRKSLTRQWQPRGTVVIDFDIGAQRLGEILVESARRILVHKSFGMGKRLTYGCALKRIVRFRPLCQDGIQRMAELVRGGHAQRMGSQQHEPLF